MFLVHLRAPVVDIEAYVFWCQRALLITSTYNLLASSTSWCLTQVALISILNNNNKQTKTRPSPKACHQPLIFSNLDPFTKNGSRLILKQETNLNTLKDLPNLHSLPIKSPLP